MSRPEDAVEMFGSGYSCSQAILATYGEEFGMDRKTALKLGCGFEGGMGLMGHTCGAVAASVMLIGLKYGNTSAKDAGARKRTLETVKLFLQEFVARHGSSSCRGLVGRMIDTPEKLDEALKADAFARCPGYVLHAAQMLEKML